MWKDAQFIDNLGSQIKTTMRFNYIPPEWPKSKWLKTPNVYKSSITLTRYLLVGVETDTTSSKNSLTLLKLSMMMWYNVASSPVIHIPNRNVGTHPPQMYVHRKVYKSTLWNSLKLKTTQMFFKGKNRSTVVYYWYSGRKHRKIYSNYTQRHRYNSQT